MQGGKFCFSPAPELPWPSSYVAQYVRGYSKRAHGLTVPFFGMCTCSCTCACCAAQGGARTCQGAQTRHPGHARAVSTTAFIAQEKKRLRELAVEPEKHATVFLALVMLEDSTESFSLRSRVAAQTHARPPRLHHGGTSTCVSMTSLLLAR